jgi:hypothetical protein
MPGDSERYANGAYANGATARQSSHAQQHLELPGHVHGLALPVVVGEQVHLLGLLGELLDLGHPLGQFFLFVRVVVALPGVIMTPPFLVVVGTTEKQDCFSPPGWCSLHERHAAES